MANHESCSLRQTRFFNHCVDLPHTNVCKLLPHEVLSDSTIHSILLQAAKNYACFNPLKKDRIASVLFQMCHLISCNLGNRMAASHNHRLTQFFFDLIQGQFDSFCFSTNRSDAQSSTH